MKYERLSSKQIQWKQHDKLQATLEVFKNIPHAKFKFIQEFQLSYYDISDMSNQDVNIILLQQPYFFPHQQKSLIKTLYTKPWPDRMSIMKHLAAKEGITF